MLGEGGKVVPRFESIEPELLALLLFVGSQEPVRLRGSLHRSTTALGRLHAQVELADTQRELLAQALRLLARQLQEFQSEAPK